MSTAASVVVRISADTAEFTSKLRAAEKSADRFLTTLAQQNATFGMSADRARYYGLQLRGASDAVLKQIDAQIKLKESLIASAKAKEALSGGGDFFGSLAGGSRFISQSFKLFGLVQVFHLVERAITEVRENFEALNKTDTEHILTFGEKLFTSIVESLPIVGQFAKEYFKQAEEMKKAVAEELEALGKKKAALEELAKTEQKYRNAINPPSKTAEIKQKYDAEIASLRKQASQSPFDLTFLDKIKRAIELAEAARSAELNQSANRDVVQQSIESLSRVNLAEQYLDKKREELEILQGLTKEQQELNELFKAGGNIWQQNELKNIQAQREAMEYLERENKASAENMKRHNEAVVRDLQRRISESSEAQASIGSVLTAFRSQSAPSAALSGSREAANLRAQSAFSQQTKPQLDLLRAQLVSLKNLERTARAQLEEAKRKQQEADV